MVEQTGESEGNRRGDAGEKEEKEEKEARDCLQKERDQEREIERESTEICYVTWNCVKIEVRAIEQSEFS